MALGIGLFNSITGTGKASSQLPEQQDIVARYQDSVSVDDKQWIDTKGSGDYEVEEAESIDIAPGKTIEFSTIGVGFSLTVNSGTSTCSFTGTTLSCTVGGSLFDFALSDGSTTWTYSGGEGSDGITLYANEVGGPTGTLTGFTLPTDRQQSIEFGHEWSNYSVIGDGSKIAEDQTSPGLDVLGNPLTNPGTPQKNMKVTGYTGAWDGTAYGMFGSEVELSGDFEISFRMKYRNDGTSQILLGADLVNTGLVSIASNLISIYITSIQYIFSDLTLVAGTSYNLSIIRVGSDVSIYSSGQLVQTIASTSAITAYNQVGSRTGGTSNFNSDLLELKIADDGTLVNHWVCESDPTSLQDTIYDIVGGNHAILTNATIPFFTTEMEGSKLFADGFDSVGGSTGLVPARADGLSAIGQPLTNGPAEFIDEYALFYAPLSVSFYDMSVIAGIDTDLYLAGAAIGLTADAWILLANNPLFFGAVQNMLVAYDAVQSGDTLGQINNYLGI